MGGNSRKYFKGNASNFPSKFPSPKHLTLDRSFKQLQFSKISNKSQRPHLNKYSKTSQFTAQVPYRLKVPSKHRQHPKLFHQVYRSQFSSKSKKISPPSSIADEISLKHLERPNSLHKSQRSQLSKHSKKTHLPSPPPDQLETVKKMPSSSSLKRALSEPADERPSKKASLSSTSKHSRSASVPRKPQKKISSVSQERAVSEPASDVKQDTNSGRKRSLSEPDLDHPAKKVKIDIKGPAADDLVLGKKYRKYARTIRKNRILSNRVRNTLPSSLHLSRPGLPNLTGVLCYRNSLFQALFHSPIFVNWLVNDHKRENCSIPNSANCVPCNLRQLVVIYLGLEKKNLTQAYRNTNSLFKNLGWRAGRFLNSQGDPEEQYTWMTDTMKRGMPREILDLFTSFHTIITNLSITCRACKNVSTNENNVSSVLPVPLQPYIKGGALESFIRPAMSNKVTDYKCEKCGNKSDKTRTTSIAHLPDLLVLQLMRFNFSGRKDSSLVQYGLELDLSQYRAAGNTDSAKYELNAVVLHSGGSTSSGHYECFGRSEKGTWRLFDDEHVSKVTEKVVLAPGRRTPYLLFYQRVRE